MMSDWLYQYPPLYPGILVKRYKRFFADIELASGEVITAHCPNTGPMTGVCTIGANVQVSYSDNPKRKLAYTWEMIEVCDTEPTWVGINTALPNRVIKLALEKRLFPQLGDYEGIQGEVPYGLEKKSRVDFVLFQSLEETLNSVKVKATLTPTIFQDDLLLETSKVISHSDSDKITNAASCFSPSSPPANYSLNGLTDTPRTIYLEVKNTTFTNGKLALFPDTVTERGQKHLRELMALLPAIRPVMLYFINRSDCTSFAPGDNTDPVYGKLLREAVAKGLEVLPCRFEVTPVGIRYLGLAKFEVSES
ncbi:DNA/RNA nuclease SfsA [Microcoleus sp. FACHB-672]|uniref:DNA/RNA nuclease SfsA n=1 Tax=Microcoleus sp. FACHB-672 TaxID=2692825 RepID=UPI001686E7A6|nr:DNA/RNA nuclease SfsA [Microcoleus sp. FACHB-672]MBD2043835.1 DNA/RNA nuclease SfsA [Microcoleus sp. FACHB-672]